MRAERSLDTCQRRPSDIHKASDVRRCRPVSRVCPAVSSDLIMYCVRREWYCIVLLPVHVIQLHN